MAEVSNESIYYPSPMNVPKRRMPFLLAICALAISGIVFFAVKGSKPSVEDAADKSDANADKPAAISVQPVETVVKTWNGRVKPAEIISIVKGFGEEIRFRLEIPDDKRFKAMAKNYNKAFANAKLSNRITVSKPSSAGRSAQTVLVSIETAGKVNR